MVIPKPSQPCYQSSRWIEDQRTEIGPSRFRCRWPLCVSWELCVWGLWRSCRRWCVVVIEVWQLLLLQYYLWLSNYSPSCSVLYSGFKQDSLIVPGCLSSRIPFDVPPSGIILSKILPSGVFSSLPLPDYWFYSGGAMKLSPV